MDYNREYGTEVRIVRIFNTYGPRMALDDGRVVSNFVSQVRLAAGSRPRRWLLAAGADYAAGRAAGAGAGSGELGQPSPRGCQQGSRGASTRRPPPAPAARYRRR